MIANEIKDLKHYTEKCFSVYFVNNDNTYYYSNLGCHNDNLYDNSHWTDDIYFANEYTFQEALLLKHLLSYIYPYDFDLIDISFMDE